MPLKECIISSHCASECAVCQLQELIAHDAPRRHKLSVHIISTAPAVTGDSPEVAVSAPTLESAPPTDDGNALCCTALHQV